MNNSPLIIVDADAIVSLANKDDANHERAKRILKHLTSINASALFPITAISEATTVLQRKLSNPQAARFVIEQVQSGNFPIQIIDHAAITTAISLFHPHGSKQNTLFDAIIASIARQLNAEAIFSFDQWYRKQGLTLTSDFIEEQKQAV